MSKSALSRLESGARPLSLAHLCRLAHALGVTPDALLSDHAIDEGTGSALQRTTDGRDWQPLPTPTGSAFQVHLITLPANTANTADLHERAHAGKQWLFVLTGTLRITLAGRTRVLTAGEQANFSTQLVHQLHAIDQPTTILALFQPR